MNSIIRFLRVFVTKGYIVTVKDCKTMVIGVNRDTTVTIKLLDLPCDGNGLWFGVCVHSKNDYTQRFVTDTFIQGYEKTLNEINRVLGLLS